MGAIHNRVDLTQLASQLEQIADTVRTQGAAQEFIVEALPQLPISVFVDASKEGDGPELLLIAVAWAWARQAREKEFGEDLFCDPAWNMLLDLYIQSSRGCRVGVSSLCIAAGTPMTTALRWISLLVERDLVEREADQFDKRRTYVKLTAAGRKKMEGALRGARDSDRKLGLGRLQPVN